MDDLSQIIDRFSMQAGVFYTGKLCGLSHHSDDDGAVDGHIHLLRSGTVTLINSEQRKIVLDKPSVIFFAKTTKHTLMAEQSHDAELICASVHYGIGRNNALTHVSHFILQTRT